MNEAFEAFVAAAIAPAQEVADLVRDDPETGELGWSAVVDPSRAPAGWLPWLSLLAGADDDESLSEAGRRVNIAENPRRIRGTLPSLNAAVRATLANPVTARVYISERHGSAYGIRVATFEADTPNPTATEAAARRAKRVGLVLTYDLIAGGDWDALESTHADWDEVDTDFSTWADVLTDPSHT